MRKKKKNNRKKKQKIEREGAREGKKGIYIEVYGQKEKGPRKGREGGSKTENVGKLVGYKTALFI